MTSERTIIAVASARGAAERGILRLSGAQAVPLALRFVEGCAGELGSGVHLGTLRLRDWTMPCALWIRRAPRSATGEDCVELHLESVPLLLHELQQALVDAGAALAAPGEFTRRAFANGRIDLLQAEAVGALTAAEGEEQRRAAMDMLNGGLSRRVQSVERLVHSVLIPLELGFDFSDQDVVIPLPDGALEDLRRAGDELRELADSGGAVSAAAARRLVVLRGPANAGKSTLFNALAGGPAALVSALPGTTRDALRCDAVCVDLAVTYVDTAGDDAGCADSDVAAHQLRKALEAQADLVVEVRAPQQPVGVVRGLLVRTHADESAVTDGLCVSGKTGAGLEELRTAIHAALVQRAARTLPLSVRQAQLLGEAAAALHRAHAQLASNGAGELVAADLHAALAAMAALTGRDAPQDLLDRIFSGFCIGK